MRTLDPAIEVRVGGDFETRMGHEETGDVGETGVNMLPHVLQLLMLIL